MRAFRDGLVLSIGYFTQIPVPFKVQHLDRERYKYLALTLPLSGMLLGGLTVLLFLLLVPYANNYFAALLCAVFYLGLYGFLHLEAVTDIVDAWYGGHSGKDRYAIMKDPHIGAVGALWTFSLVMIKTAAIVLVLVNGAYGGFIAVLLLSRWMVLWMIYLGSFHKNSAFIRKLQESLDLKSLFLATLVFSGILWVTGAVWMPVTAVASALLLYRWLMREFGFVNGDGLGFVIEITEIVLLIVLVFTVT